MKFSFELRIEFSQLLERKGIFYRNCVCVGRDSTWKPLDINSSNLTFELVLIIYAEIVIPG